MIKTESLVQFYEDRNLIIHNYRRVFMMKIKGKPPRSDGVEFLQKFIVKSRGISEVLLGLIHIMAKAAAVKEGREKELDFGEKEEACIKTYHNHAIKYKLENSSPKELLDYINSLFGALKSDSKR